MKLDNKTAIITGGASGIGLESAKLFISEGANVIIADLNESEGRPAAEALGSRCRFVKTDVSDKSSAYFCVMEALKRFGSLEILVNNAGITSDASLHKMSSEQFEKVIDVNLKGVFFMTKYAAAQMAENNFGRIINTSSIVGLYGNFGQTNYAASKSGVIGMTKTWARELGRKGITVNAVAPGFIDTGMLNTVPANILDNIKQRTPLGRLGSPADIAKAYLFLASDDAAFITGITLSVDGGLVW
ncbi:MAG TPA: 3-oxoacyl-ACP reductase FabG [Ignavibacteria bacterium]|nr:3-oxoacyl-ACP reductase FabG [Ignavibacteria bacterium]HRF66406.1 3-oxoacyl-ACP reductase FabG [Ignavibacteria bacterium]HRJ05314.1 3-oxoacyl-ACP reductase FabG [Ignavibacteria bacterium]